MVTDHDPVAAATAKGEQGAVLPSCWASIVCPLLLRKGAAAEDKGVPGMGHAETWRQLCISPQMSGVEVVLEAVFGKGRTSVLMWGVLTHRKISSLSCLACVY